MGVPLWLDVYICVHLIRRRQGTQRRAAAASAVLALRVGTSGQVVNCFKFKTIHNEHQDDMSWQLLAQGSES